MRMGLNKLLNFFINLSLFLLSVFLTIVFLEIIIRVTCPKYKYAAEAQFNINQARIFENSKNSKSQYQHPDSNKNHLVIHNSLGFRQHREFSRNKPKDVIRIGFFGDSFTENLRMESQYSFTEPLDYLLNETGKKYEIMNFGTDGYGTDQIYLQYLQEGRQLGLDVVIYIYCRNDLRNINENNLLKLDQKGNIETNRYVENKLINIINKLYITYFVLEHSSFLRNHVARHQNAILKEGWGKRYHFPRYEAVQKDFADGIITNDVRETLRIYLTIILQMKQVCDKHNVRFYVATLPFEQDNAMHDFLVKNGFIVINFYDEFRKVYPAQQFYQFKNDPHWNEEGNKLAAIFLFKFLAKELSINYSGDEFIEQSLYQYYNSFESGKVTNYSVEKHGDFSPTLNNGIRSKYLFLEKSN